MTSFPLPDQRTLVVAGSLSAKPQDRVLDRSDIRSVQLLLGGQFVDVEGLRDTGDLGCASLAFPPEGRELFISGGADVVRIDLENGIRTDLAVDGLRDVHEMTVTEAELLVANTGADEVVVLDRRSCATVERISLDGFRGRSRMRAGSGEDVVDRFHLNQVFAGLDGHRLALVHHVEGRQLVRYVAEKALKVHGDGGVLDLTSGKAIPLRLSAPHSVRVVNGAYWVFDSSRSQARAYDESWRPRATFATAGWGRGAAVVDGGHTYVGMSPIRRRYLPSGRGRSRTEPLLEAFTADGTTAGTMPVPGVENINGVFAVPRATADVLSSLSA